MHYLADRPFLSVHTASPGPDDDQYLNEIGWGTAALHWLPQPPANVNYFTHFPGFSELFYPGGRIDRPSGEHLFIDGSSGAARRFFDVHS
jgi:hypothetical protein